MSVINPMLNLLFQKQDQVNNNEHPNLCCGSTTPQSDTPNIIDVMLNFHATTYSRTLHAGCYYRLVKTTMAPCNTNTQGFCDNIDIAHLKRVVEKSGVRQNVNVSDSVVLVDINERRCDKYRVCNISVGDIHIIHYC